MAMAVFAVASTTKILQQWFVAFTAPLVLTAMAAAVDPPVFVVIDITVLLVVSVALLSGIGPAMLSVFVAVFTDDVMVVSSPDKLPVTLLEDLLHFALLVGIAVVVNRLVVQARYAQAAAELGAQRERRVHEERERVVATVAHDLATPLTVVRGTVQVAKRRGLGHDTDDKQLLNRLETAAARASSLVKTLSDPEDFGGVRPDRVQTVDLCEILRTIAGMMEQASDRHSIELEVPNVPIPIKADAERLHRVFENILNNAIKYSPDADLINIAVRHDRDEARVLVRDRGIGIAPEARKHIFDLAYRAPEAQRASTGRGLGLHIAAQIVTAHRGTITAQAAPGGGTDMVVSLPVFHEAPRATSSRLG
jgi:two-component system, OmpR family, manganese sensing sensor histidine kinase